MKLLQNSRFLVPMLAFGASLQVHAQLIIDNFTVPLARQTLTTVGTEQRFEQTGAGIAGGKRTVTLKLSADPYRQGAMVEIQNRVLVLSTGYKVTDVIQLIYANGQQLNIDFTRYKKLIVEFDGADRGLNFNITLHSKKTNTYTGFSVNQPMMDQVSGFRIEAPVPDFLKGKTPADFDLGSVDSIVFVIQSLGFIGSHDFGIKSIRLE